MVEKDPKSHFPPSNLEEWREKVLRELRIQHPDELDWITPEGFPLQALYHRPGNSPNPNAQTFESSLTQRAYHIWEPLQMGIPSLLQQQMEIISQKDITHLFVDSIPTSSKEGWEELQTFHFNVPITVSLPQGLVDSNIFPSKEAPDIRLRQRVYPWEADLPIGEIEWDFRKVYEAGGTLALQMATCLAALVQGLSQSEEFSRIKAMHFSVGTSFYLEIAKFRVLPSLIQLVFQQVDLPMPEIAIIAHTSTRDLGKNDVAINAIRSTLAVLAASLGGCQGVCASPIAEEPNHFDLRLARNIHFLLAEEGKIHKVQDPLAGSYYIEEVGKQLGKKVWELFLKIESQGGLLGAWEKGIISRWMAEGAEKERLELKNLEKVKIAENSYLHEKN